MREFMEVAVYRVSLDRWVQELRDRIRPALERWKAEHPDASGDEVRRQQGLLEEFATRGERHPYNQVVAWVRLEATGDGVVKGYAWGLPQTRVMRDFRRAYEYKHKVLEVWFHPGDSSDDICRELREALVGLVAASGPFPKRHVDLDAFDGLGPFVDWHQLVGLRG